jgi:hypothetical protein
LRGSDRATSLDRDQGHRDRSNQQCYRSLAAHCPSRRLEGAGEAR